MMRRVVDALIKGIGRDIGRGERKEMELVGKVSLVLFFEAILVVLSSL